MAYRNEKLDKDLIEQVRCDECGEFYHPEYMNVRK